MADILRRPGYLRLLAVCAIVGVPVSAAAFGFLALEHALQPLLWEDLPDAVGLDEAPWWWGIPALVVCGVIVAVVATRLPGGGGPVPAEHATPAPTQPRFLPGILIAGFASLGLGAVIGPEGILLAFGSGLALLLVRVREPSVAAIVGASGAFAAISAILGSPLVGAVFMIEAIGLGGARMFAVLLPGLLSAGIGSLMFTGLGDWTGLEIDTLAAPAMPGFERPDVADVAWAVPLAALAALLAFVIRAASARALPLVRARPLVVIAAAGAVVGALGGAYALITGHPPDEALFSGQETLGTLLAEPGGWSDGDLVVLLACVGLGYTISLAAFRGGPIFPAILLGAALGTLLDDLPGLGRAPAVAIMMGAFTVAILRLPLSSILLVTLLLASSGLGLGPLVILAAITAFVLTELIDPPERVHDPHRPA
jgi:H+/Cl- antiporter ClcA